MRWQCERFCPETEHGMLVCPALTSIRPCLFSIWHAVRRTATSSFRLMEKEGRRLLILRSIGARYFQSHYIDKVISKEKRKVDENDALNIPVALAPPRRWPPKNYSERLPAWCKRGRAEKRKRAYTCGLLRVHNAQCQRLKVTADFWRGDTTTIFFIWAAL